MHRYRQYDSGLLRIYRSIVLKVDPNDGLPQKVCSACTYKLLSVYETVEIFRANDLKMREQVTRMMPVEIKDIV